MRYLCQRLGGANSDPLWRDSLLCLRDELIDAQRSTLRPEDCFALLTPLIDRRLQLTEVNRYLPPEPTREQLDARMAAIRARFASQAAFDAALAEGGLTLEQLTGRVRETLRIESYRN